MYLSVTQGYITKLFLQLVNFLYFAVGVLYCLLNHAFHRRVGELYAKFLQMSVVSNNVLGDIQIIVHSLEPRPAAVCLLHLRELFGSLAGFGLYAGKVEQNANVLLVLGFVLGIEEPWRIFEKYRFQFLVALQVRFQSFGICTLPLVEHFLNLLVGICNVRRNEVGINARESLFGALVWIFHHIRQCKHSVPCGIRCKFERV